VRTVHFGNYALYKSMFYSHSYFYLVFVGYNFNKHTLHIHHTVWSITLQHQTTWAVSTHGMSTESAWWQTALAIT